MNNFRIVVCWFVALATVICVAQTTPNPSSRQAHLRNVLAKAALSVKQTATVPPRIPAYIPGLESEQNLYAIITFVDRDSYTVVLGATPDCEGQQVCSYATFIGTTRRLTEIDEYGLDRRRASLVKLKNGLIGYFYKSVCDAYCSDSLIVWTEGRYHYIIGLKAERQSTLLNVANSAIQVTWK